ncbi:MAG: hypothetical protein OJF59_000009 [Cytophagales bacterium]|jgi:hypothetical protein|nr:hypothetical protein [Bacteroidota bacterium]MBS1982476.1 hypothetical protein [Bacteroidota bacterium]WHZ06257.1 MAG: hypothetical protein OJF59_000009 [Cytophagales bacterium]
MNYYFVFFFCLILFASQAQDTSELEKRNGFKDIKLGSPADSVKGILFKKNITELKEFEAKLYEVNDPAYEKVGDADIRQVKLKVYKGLIYEIILTTRVDPRIMMGLEKLYGKAKFNLRHETYSWSVPGKITLVYKGSPKEVTLTYRSPPVIKMMYLDKNKKIEAVAEDF